MARYADRMKEIEAEEKKMKSKREPLVDIGGVGIEFKTKTKMKEDEEMEKKAKKERKNKNVPAFGYAKINRGA